MPERFGHFMVSDDHADIDYELEDADHAEALPHVLREASLNPDGSTRDVGWEKDAADLWAAVEYVRGKEASDA